MNDLLPSLHVKSTLNANHPIIAAKPRLLAPFLSDNDHIFPSLPRLEKNDNIKNNENNENNLSSSPLGPRKRNNQFNNGLLPK